MGRSVSDDNDDAFGLGAKRKLRRIGERVELIFGDVTAAAGVQRADPVAELLDVRSERLAIRAVAVGIRRDDVVLERYQAEPVVAAVRLQVLRKRNHVLLDGVDIRLHRFGDVEHEHDVDGTALADAAEIDDLGFLAVLEDLDVVGTKTADRIAVFIGQTEVELDAAVGVEVLEAGIPGGDLQARIRRGHPNGESETDQQEKRKHVAAQAEVSIRGVHRWQQFSGSRWQSVKLPVQLDAHSSDCILAFAHWLGYPNR